MYDLTTFGADHPGGIEVLQNVAGLDGTESYDYANHSESNMEKLEQYRVGRLAGSLPQVRSVPQKTSPAQSRRIRSAPPPKQCRFGRWVVLAVAMFAVALVVVLSYYRRRDDLVDYITPSMNITQLPYGTKPIRNSGSSFWTGVAVASSISCVGFSYLYKLFQSSLDYQNDIFAFPPTIPRRKKN